MLKGKLTAFAAVIIIMWGGGGIRNIQSQSKIPEAGGRTASEPVSPPLYFAAHPIHTEVPSDHPQIVPIAYPHLNPYFCSHGIFQLSLLSKSDGGLLFPSWETFAMSLLLSDWHLSSVSEHSRPLLQKTQCIWFQVPAQMPGELCLQEIIHSSPILSLAPHAHCWVDTVIL